MGKIDLIDAHVHLYDEESLSSLRWMDKSLPISCEHIATKYRAQNWNQGSSPFNFKGVIYIESDVKTDLSCGLEGFTPAVRELKFVIEQSIKEEGLIIAIIPWAPVPLGPQTLELYLNKLFEDINPQQISLVKGFRFLLQDKPDGIMVSRKFIESIKWLASKNFVFELGIDFHRRGDGQYREVGVLFESVKDAAFVIDHFGKPNLAVDGFSDNLNAWKRSMKNIHEIALKNNNAVYLKLSGLLSELDKHAENLSYEEIVQSATPYFEYALQTFGPSRVIWGSDWPVCKLNGGERAFPLWRDLTMDILNSLEASDDLKQRVFSLNAVEAYNIHVS
ncbi:hypothetical protein KL930_004705 [Ogataea haglerorum]|nr:hypothetical protein KL930_004705 [Ogataea haglerorum]KAG7780176.1 hypothetical protein KL922_001461 [Ogataea haglerorum]